MPLITGPGGSISGPGGSTSTLQNVPTVEPECLQAGDTLRFNKTLWNFSGPDWTLTYSLISPTLQPITFDTVSDGSTFEVNVPSATTAEWEVGTYLMTGTVSDGTDRFTVYQAEIRITPNAAAATDVVEYRSWCERTLALVELTLSGAIARRDISYSINGRSITAKTDKELFEARDYLKACLAQENSRGKNRRILTKFVRI